jgi:hypothetical protein
VSCRKQARQVLEQLRSNEVATFPPVSPFRVYPQLKPGQLMFDGCDVAVTRFGMRPKDTIPGQ